MIRSKLFASRSLPPAHAPKLINQENVANHSVVDSHAFANVLSGSKPQKRLSVALALNASLLPVHEEEFKQLRVSL